MVSQLSARLAASHAWCALLFLLVANRRALASLLSGGSCIAGAGGNDFAGAPPSEHSQGGAGPRATANQNEVCDVRWSRYTAHSSYSWRLAAGATADANRQSFIPSDRAPFDHLRRLDCDRRAVLASRSHCRCIGPLRMGHGFVCWPRGKSGAHCRHLCAAGGAGSRGSARCSPDGPVNGPLHGSDS